MQAESREETGEKRRGKRGKRKNLITGSAPETPEQRDANKQYMVYEEISIVITTDAFAERDQIVSTTSALYRAVQDFLNANLNLADFPQEWYIPQMPLFVDLVPPSEYRFEDFVPSERRPGVLLKRKDGTGTAILFYKLAFSPLVVESKSPVERAKPIRTLAALINAQFAKKQAGRYEKWQIDGATPNWLATAASDDSGSPAAPPQPGPDPGDVPKKWTFNFEDPANTTNMQRTLQGNVDTQRAATAVSNVVVAILDTCPHSDIQTLAQTFPKNELFKEVAGLVGLGNPVSLMPSSPSLFSQIQGAVPSWLGWLLPLFTTPYGAASTKLIDDYYSMPSHGLFSAGIVKDIVPNATIHLIGVLNDAGMSSQDVLAAVFLNLPSLITPEQDLVVNCSWTTSTLADDAIAELVDDLILDVLIQWLNEQNMLVVAAVGNNALDPIYEGVRPDARYPADFDLIGNVLSVMATDITVSGPAQYTNNASGMGVATIGGDAVLTGGQSVLEGETVAPMTWDAIKGIYWEPKLVIAGVPNTSGWVSWAGTSFATPIISAIAAVLWTGSTLPVLTIIRKVQGSGVAGLPGLTVNTIYARQI